MTETLLENEELHDKLRELDAENNRLRERLEDLERQALNTEEELRLCKAQRETASPAASPRAGGEEEGREEPKVRSPARSPGGKFKLQDADQRELEEKDFERQRLLTQVDTQEDEILQLRGKVEEAEENRQQLKRESMNLKVELETVQHQRQQDQAMIQELAATVQELERALSSERSQSQARLTPALDDFLEDGPGAGPARGFPCESLMDELSSTHSQTPQPGLVPKLLGHLQKKSPSALRQLRPYQRRFVAVESGKMSWWTISKDHPDQSKCCGSVDLCINPCIIEVDPREADKFILRPLEQVRVAGLTASSHANGLYQRAEFRADAAVRYKKDDPELPMVLYWLGKWYLGPDTCVSNAVASKEGPDTQEALTSPRDWEYIQDFERGQMRVTLGGAWVAGSFTGAHAGRILEFSAQGSEYGREQWVQVIRQQVELGRNRRASLSLLGPEKALSPSMSGGGFESTSPTHAGFC